MAGYIYVPLLLSVLIVLGFVLSGGLILSEETSPVGEITEKYTLVDKEASPSSQTLQLSTLDFVAQVPQVTQFFCENIDGEYDIALVIDNSNSITFTSLYLQTMKDVMISLVNSFSGTSTQFSVTRFSTTAEVVQPFTYDIDKVKSAINSIGKDNSIDGGSTNWQDGLSKTKETLDSALNRPSVPDFVVFASDGEPNRIGEDGRTTSVGDAVDKASLVADDIKRSKAKIFVLGIGGNLESGGGYLIQNLIKIAGSQPGYQSRLNFYKNGGSTGDYVILTDFNKLGADIAKVTVHICGP